MIEKQVTRRDLVVAMDEAMAELARACSTMSNALRETNDPGLQTFFGDIVARIVKIVENARNGLTRHVASDLVNARSALRRMRVPDTDAELGSQTQALKALRYGRGNLTEALDFALEAAAGLRITPLDADMPVVAIARKDVEVQLARLDERLRIVEEGVQDLRSEIERDASNSPSAIAQTNAIKYNVETLDDQAKAARFETRTGDDPSIPRDVDFTVLSRAIGVMKGVGADLQRAVSGLGGPIRDGVRIAGQGLVRTVQRAHSGFKTVVSWVRQALRVIDPGTPTKAIPVEDLPPPDFDMKQVREMILDGEEPPRDWTPWIRDLNFYGTKLFDLKPISSLTALEALFLNSTSIGKLSPLSSLTNLKTLSIWDTNVSDLSALSALTELRTLYIGRTWVKNLASLSSLASLQTLDLTETPVNRVSVLSSLTELQTLNLRDTRVSDISALSGLTKLQRLNLAGTPVRDVSALSGLLALKQLDLTGTAVRSLATLAALENLNQVYVSSSLREEIAKTHPRGADIVKTHR